MVKVKICGIQWVEDAEEAVRLGADFLGFNLYPRSPRYLPPDEVVSIVGKIPSSVTTVGLFVNEERSWVEQSSRLCGFGALQFHGDEDALFLEGWSQKVIQAVRMTGPESRGAVEAGLKKADWVLVDASSKGYGGAGKQFPWEWLQGISGERLFLAGGLDPSNVAMAVSVFRPFAVDVASGVEKAPGVKDWRKLKEFIEHAKNA
jgi:phosphoribosylanthranilate isomerase